MTRTLSILTGALIALSAVAPLLTARVLGGLETRATIAGACLDAPAVEVPPAAPPQTDRTSCSADDGSKVQP